MPDYRANPDTGAVAVKAGKNRWGVMHPTNGGHWADDAEVKDWTELKDTK